MADQPQTAEELIAHIQAQNQIAHEAHVRDVDAVVEMGRSDYRNFDQACQDFSNSVGSQAAAEITAACLQHENPAAILHYLGEHTAEAEAIAKMPPGRRLTAIAKLEARLAPNVTESASAELEWRRRAKTGGKVDLMDESVSSEAWEREFKRKYYTGGGFDRPLRISSPQKTLA